LENQSFRQGPRLLISLFFAFTLFFFNPCCSNYVRMKKMQLIDDIVAAFPFLNNFKVDMADFMDSHKVVVSARNEGALKGGGKK